MCRTHSRSTHLFPHSSNSPQLPQIALIVIIVSQLSHCVILSKLFLMYCLPSRLLICYELSPLRPRSSHSKPKCRHSSPIVSQSLETSPNSQQMCRTHSRSSHFALLTHTTFPIVAPSFQFASTASNSPSLIANSFKVSQLIANHQLLSPTLLTCS